MKKVNKWIENKVRESKISENKCVDFYWKEKWLHCYRTYENDKMTPLL